MPTDSLPTTQPAVQVTGPGRVELNPAKAVPRPGPHQILARVEAVGLCFSDLKLLKQFDGHVRKSEVVGGLAAEVLREIPSYVPGTRPTVPGHEVVCRVLEVGSAVQSCKPGERYLVQPDFRAFPTAGANAAFGYNFEGALQQFILLDERVIREPSGESYLLPVADRLGASEAALAEPWACVEDSYVTGERQCIKAGGRLLVALDPGRRIEGLREAFSPDGPPAEVLLLGGDGDAEAALAALGKAPTRIAQPLDVADESLDDVVYFGATRAVAEALNGKLAARGIFNVVLGGKRFGEPVSVGVGRIHYGLTRWIGTTGASAADAYRTIPPTGEARDGDDVLVIGAGGPMGQMHVLRGLFLEGRTMRSVVAADFDDARLAGLARKASAPAATRGTEFRTVNPQKEESGNGYSYFTVMAPVGAIVADCIARAREGALINVFAGIPAPVCHELDLDTLIEKRIFLFGTSGSTIEDMRIVLGKVTAGTLDTDASVDAVSGMAGAIEGIEAVENRTMAGKIVVYPELERLGLTPIDRLGERFPTVAAKLRDGQWCREAEVELLHVAREQERT